MSLPGTAWVALILLLIPVVQGWVAQQWPEAQYPATALVVGLLMAVAKWLEMVFRKPALEAPQFEAGPGSKGLDTRPGRVQRFFLG